MPLQETHSAFGSGGEVHPQLVLAKRLFLEASEFTNRQDPVSSGIAISMLQDAAEIYIWTLVKKTNIKIKNRSGFVENIELLEREGTHIPGAAKLRELNSARVGFKHYGNLPASSEVTKHTIYVEDFLRTAMWDHFSVRFDELSLVDLVANAPIRDLLKEGERHIQAGDLKQSAEALAKARVLTFAALEKHVPAVDANLREGDRQIALLAKSRSTNFTHFAYLGRYLSELREAVIVALLRVPLAEHNFLRSYLPMAAQAHAGNWYIQHRQSEYTADECKKALEQIIKVCARLEQFS